MRKDEYFCDVTLACDGDQKIEAHKVILAASSIFFEKLLKQNKHPHPLLYIRGVTSYQLSAVVDFIYYGEVNIYEENLEEFLALAEELQLRGLNNSEAESKIKDPQQRPPLDNPTKLRTVPDKLPFSDFEANLRNYADPRIEETSMVLADSSVKTKTNHSELDKTINSMLEILENGKHSCMVCGKIDPNNHLTNLRRHIESKHIEGISHQCSICGKYFRSKNSLASHTSKIHKPT